MFKGLTKDQKRRRSGYSTGSLQHRAENNPELRAKIAEGRRKHSADQAELERFHRFGDWDANFDS